MIFAWDPSKVVSNFFTSNGWVISDELKLRHPQVASFIDSYVISNNDDKLVWAHAASGKVSCNDLYKFLSKGSQPNGEWRHTWASFIPPYRLVLCWRLLNNRFPMEDGLFRLGFHIVSCSVLYSNPMEHINHLFFTLFFRKESLVSYW